MMLRRLSLGLSLLVLANAPAHAGTFDARKAQCRQCHGGNGVSSTPETPSLGGQPEAFLLYQLVWFREGQRDVPVMNEMTRGMSDDDLRAAAGWMGTMPPPPPPDKPGDPRRMRRGKALADQYRCGFCHEPDYSGHEQIPRLANQREDYLLKALQDYKNERRIAGGATMIEVLHPLDDDELATLAHYLAHVR